MMTEDLGRQQLDRSGEAQSGVWLQQGMNLIHHKRVAEALALSEQALALDAQNEPALCLKRYALAELGQLEASKAKE